MGVTGNSLTPSHQFNFFAEALPEAVSQCCCKDLFCPSLGEFLKERVSRCLPPQSAWEAGQCYSCSSADGDEKLE